ncbi:MAG TPA: anthranilate phosphoribosyltransferase [Bacteroidota bacterium]|nr:anthranilate phosphoribosyltransferase [Bacteroidota bacterium]
MIRESIHKLIAHHDLSREEAYDTMSEIMSGNASEMLIASFLTALRLKGETVQEIAGCAQAMREKATKIESKRANVIDTCGTGGDSLGTFNISTAAAIVVSGAGTPVAKHGNRAISSKCGSADVLKALGVNIEIPKEKVEQCLDEVGIAFLFAPIMHGAMKYAGPVRRELGIRTVFNILGPLTNPAGARRQLLGVFDGRLTEPLARVLLELGSERALVVHGEGGLDEISTLGKTIVSELKGGAVTTYEVHHSKFGIPASSLSDVAGGDAEFNARIVRDILNGKKGPQRDITVLNAGAALYAAESVPSIQEGIRQAEASIDKLEAKKKLEALVEFSNYE